MSYELRIRASAEKAIARLDPKIRQRLYDVLRQLTVNPRPNGCKKMKGELKNHYRVKAAWGWVIIYVIEDKPAKIVEVIDVDTRGDAY